MNKKIIIFLIFTVLFAGCNNTNVSPEVKFEKEIAPINSDNSNTTVKDFLSYDDLVKLADNKYSNGEVPLGDGKVTYDGAKKGYIYLCHSSLGGGGSDVEGPWLSEIS